MTQEQREELEKRAKDSYPHYTAENSERVIGARAGYIKGATDQDPISRADQQKIDTEKFLSLLDKAIEKWNEPHRHQSYVIDKEGALRRFKKAMEE